MPTPKSEQRKLAIEWMGLSPKERFDKALPLNDSDMRKYLGVKKTLWNNWINQFNAQKPKDVYMSSHPMVVGEKPVENKVVEVGDVDAEKWAKDRAIELLEATLASAKDGNATSQKLLAQIANILIEKQEVTHTLDGSFITREVLRARDELEGEGVAQVPTKPPTLLSEVCKDTGQGKKSHNKV